jgi:hypothetical protein
MRALLADFWGWRGSYRARCNSTDLVERFRHVCRCVHVEREGIPEDGRGLPQIAIARVDGMESGCDETECQPELLILFLKIIQALFKASNAAARMLHDPGNPLADSKENCRAGSHCGGDTGPVRMIAHASVSGAR